MSPGARAVVGHDLPVGVVDLASAPAELDVEARRCLRVEGEHPVVRVLTEAARDRNAGGDAALVAEPDVLHPLRLDHEVIDALAQRRLEEGDRVVARVGTVAITQTDVDSAVAFGIVEPKTADGRDPMKQMIDRRLMLGEVSRFPPAEPTEDAVNGLLAKMKAAAGDQAAPVMKRTGVDEKRLSEFARETLRIQAYLSQRFGSGPRAEQQRAQWLDDLRARGDVTEFTTPK